VKYYSLRCINSLIQLGIRNSCLISGRSPLLYPLPKRGDKTGCSNYHGISLLSTSHNILYNIPLSSLSPYVDDILGDHQCGFRSNRSTTDHIFCRRQILEKECDTMRQLFIALRKPMTSEEGSPVQYSHRVWGACVFK
jgi:hypothetical protein